MTENLAPKIFLPKNQQHKKPRKSRGKTKSSNGRGGRGGNVIPRVAQRDRMNEIQELWTPVFPARTSRRLRYSTNFSLVSASGVVASQVFSANGLFDPDITGTGHQPMGFDQLMLSYNHYTVTGAHILCTFRNTSTTTPVVSIFVAPSPTPITVIDTILEFGMLDRDTLEFKGVSGSVKSLESRCSIRKVQGVKDVVDVTDLQGTAAANPVEQTYFVVQTWDTSGISGTVMVDCIIEYDAIFTEPRVLSPSLLRDIEKLLVREQKTDAGRPKSQ